MLHITDPELIRNVMHADEFRMYVHPNATTLLGPQNMAFMHGPEHAALRKALVPLFTRRALAFYLPRQDKLIRESIASWYTR